MDLFDDLPEPVNNSSSNGATSDQLSGESVIRGEKRKSTETTTDNEKNKKTDMQTHAIIFGYAVEVQGEREEMQDAHVIINNFESQIEHLHSVPIRVSLYAVFDGHGGCRASKFAATHLPENLVQKFPKDVTQVDKDIGKCLVEAYKKTDDDFLKEASKHKPSWKDGTTAITVLAINDTLYIANLGDSKAVLCRFNKELQKNVSIPLSKDHSPTQYDERMRIQKMGGTVRDGRVLGVLEVSRSIGDGQYKTCGVISTPDVKKCHLTEDDRFVILACDGLWKVFSADEAISYVINALQVKLDTENFDTKKFGNDPRFEAACLQLAKEAVRKGSGDNVTVVLLSVDMHCTKS